LWQALSGVIIPIFSLVIRHLRFINIGVFALSLFKLSGFSQVKWVYRFRFLLNLLLSAKVSGVILSCIIRQIAIRQNSTFYLTVLYGNLGPLINVQLVGMCRVQALWLWPK